MTSNNFIYGSRIYKPEILHVVTHFGGFISDPISKNKRVRQDSHNRAFAVHKMATFMQFTAERSRGIGATGGLNWVHILGRLCHSKYI